MQLYKIGAHGELISHKGQCVVYEGYVYTNPSKEMLYKDGYRPLGISEIPEFNCDTQTFKAESYYYSEDGSEILTKYTIEELTEIDIQQRTVEERLNALEQAGLERDAALIELAAILAGGA